MLISTVLLLPTAALPGISDIQWGGHLRIQGTVSDYEKSHVVGQAGETGPLWDGGGNFRLKSNLSLSDRFSFTTHYEAEVAGGDTRSAANDQGLTSAVRLVAPPPSDDRQLFSLTRVVSENSSRILYHRIDRLALTYSGDRGSLKLGRQALTWGNGLIFNPMDLLNPFSPADVIRDYKVGSDLALYQTFGETVTDLQLVWVPRRNTDTDHVDTGESSFAGKARLSLAGIDWDFLGGRHFDETVLGVGASGYAGDAAWRADAIWTQLSGGGDYVTAVVNLDYSWSWKEKNWYGLVEGYYNSLGDDDPQEALSDPDYSSRLSRGEVFTSGRCYLAGQIQYEAHPLLNIFASVIWNLEDGSALLQPRMIWDPAESIRMLLGVDLPMGGTGSEFGGIKVSEKNTAGPPSRAYLQMTYFF